MHTHCQDINIVEFSKESVFSIGHKLVFVSGTIKCLVDKFAPIKGAGGFLTLSHLASKCLEIIPRSGSRINHLEGLDIAVASVVLLLLMA